MNDSRHGSAGFMPYSDPGPDPGIVIRTWVLNNVAMSQVLWPAGHISVVENQFLFVPASRL